MEGGFVFGFYVVLLVDDLNIGLEEEKVDIVFLFDLLIFIVKLWLSKYS